VGIRVDVEEGRVLPKAENEDGNEEYFRWWDKE
jgi:hypothetical protein